MENNDLLMSIQPEWVYKIWTKIKTLEIRKTKCKTSSRFRIFIYCTKSGEQLYRLDLRSIVKGKSKHNELNLNGKIVGHCACTEIREFAWDEVNHCYDIDDDSLKECCLTQEQLYAYGKGKTLYGYVLSHFMPYPGGGVKLKEAYAETDTGVNFIDKAPQSWCYIHGVGYIP